MAKQFDKADILIVGAGFTGLTAGYILARAGKKVHIIDADEYPGGLAGTFEFSDGVKVEKFYHHWFNNDIHVPELVNEIGLSGDVVTLPSRTGMYFNGRIWNLSTPLDLLRFKPLSFFDRLRLGFLVLMVRRVKDWRKIEHLNIREWLEPLCGKSAYNVVWEPLIVSKFSKYAEQISSVWMWKKLVLRGGTRNNSGGEELAYFKGGFGRLAIKLVEEIKNYGGEVTLGNKALIAKTKSNMVEGVVTEKGLLTADRYLFTPAFPIIANLFSSASDLAWIETLKRVNYLGNMCLVLRLDRSLSDAYWLNVNDPGFPFVGVIEHTNFDPPQNYKGSHIVYLSRYLCVEDDVWQYSDERYFEFAIDYVQKMFPEFDKSWVIDYKVWRSEYAQPVTERNYSHFLPGNRTPFRNAFISTMAQIYPEDRGTNYAIREGRKIAQDMYSSEH